MIALSIIIVTYNNESEIWDCLKSLSNALYYSNISYEIIIIDNNSSDDTINVIDRFIIHYDRLIDIRIIHNNDNVGYAKANNQGIIIAKGNIFWLLNPDTIIPHKIDIEKLINIFQDNYIGIIGTNLLNLDGSNQGSYLRFITPGIYFYNYTLLGKAIALLMKKFGIFELWKTHDYAIRNSNVDLQYQQVEYVSGASMFIRREAIQDIGLLNEQSFMFCDDCDICMRAHLAGWDVVAPNDFSIYHIGGASSQSNYRDVTIASCTSKILFMRLYYSYVKSLLMKSLMIQDIIIRIILGIFRYNDNKISYYNELLITIMSY